MSHSKAGWCIGQTIRHVLACVGQQHGWLSSRRHRKGVKDAGGEVTSTCLHLRLPPFPRFAGHFHPLHPDSALLSSILTAAVMHTLPSLCVTSVPHALWRSIAVASTPWILNFLDHPCIHTCSIASMLRPSTAPQWESSPKWPIMCRVGH